MERRNAGSASGTPAQAVPSQGQGKSTSIRRVRRALLRDLGWVPVGKGLVFVSPITALRQRSNQHKTASCAADHIPAQSTATRLLTPLTTSTRIYRLWDEQGCPYTRPVLSRLKVLRPKQSMACILYRWYSTYDTCQDQSKNRPLLLVAVSLAKGKGIRAVEKEACGRHHRRGSLLGQREGI